MKRTQLLLLVLTAACSKGKSGPSVDLAKAVNAKLPAGSIVTFETRTISGRDVTITAAVPVGWAPEGNGMPGRLKAPKTPDLGFMTGFNVGTDCNGSCEPKEWKPIIEKLALGAVPDGPNTHVETLPNNGLIRWRVEKDEGMVYAAWYADGARNFKTCSAWLENPKLAAAIDAFVEACKTAQYE